MLYYLISVVCYCNCLGATVIQIVSLGINKVFRVWFLTVLMSSLCSNGLHSQLSNSSWGPLGCGGFEWWMHSQQMCSNCMMPYGPKYQKSTKTYFQHWLNVCHEEMRQFLRQKWFQPGKGKVYLIKQQMHNSRAAERRVHDPALFVPLLMIPCCYQAIAKEPSKKEVEKTFSQNPIPNCC